jgi:hypothetical protein
MEISCFAGDEHHHRGARFKKAAESSLDAELTEQEIKRRIAAVTGRQKARRLRRPQGLRH